MILVKIDNIERKSEFDRFDRMMMERRFSQLSKTRVIKSLEQLVNLRSSA